MDEEFVKNNVLDEKLMENIVMVPKFIRRL